MKTLLERMSPKYLRQQQEMHARPQGYGEKGFKWADTVEALIRQYDAGSVLDYGCGQGSLISKLRTRPLGGIRFAEYDPAVAGKDQTPHFADLVLITDVLEHVEPDRLDAVLEHLRMLARKAVFFVVALVPANKILDDGRNAHLIIESAEWWADRVARAGFTLSPPAGLPFHPKYKPEVQQKRWIAIGEPC